MQISHLFFADDVLLFAKANNNTLQTIKDTIQKNFVASGMEINLKKSKLWISPKVDEDRKLCISNFLQINYSSSLGNYIGYPLKAKCTSTDFNQIINKLHLKFQGWKQRLLSFAGRTQLITSTTNAILNYYIRV